MHLGRGQEVGVGTGREGGIGGVCVEMGWPRGAVKVGETGAETEGSSSANSGEELHLCCCCALSGLEAASSSQEQRLELQGETRLASS